MTVEQQICKLSKKQYNTNLLIVVTLRKCLKGKFVYKLPIENNTGLVLQPN